MMILCIMKTFLTHMLLIFHYDGKSECSTNFRMLQNMIFYFPLKINNETKITFTESKILPLFLLSSPGARAVGPSIGGAHDTAECASSAESLTFNTDCKNICVLRPSPYYTEPHIQNIFADFIYWTFKPVGCYGAQHSRCDPVVSELSIANSRTNVLVRILQYRHVLIRGMAGGSRIYPQVHAAARRVVVEDWAPLLLPLFASQQC